MTSSLNPNAQAWNPYSKPQALHPHPPQLPHVIYSHLSLSPPASSLSHTAAPLVVFASATAAPPQGPIYQLQQQFPYFQSLALPHPYYFPVSENFYAPPPPDCDSENGLMVEMNAVKGKKYPNFAVRKYGKFSCFPPRMRGRVKFSHAEQKLLEKKVWSPVKSAFPGGNGAALPLTLPQQSSVEMSTCTTVMIKNIPNQLRRDFMLKYLDQYCKDYSLEYDFLYLPMDFKKCGNYGYAFVNFTNAAAASRFKEIVQGFKWGTVKNNGGLFTSKKVIDITWANIQGKEGLVKRFQESNFMCKRLDYLPVVLDPPRNGLDPNPPPPVTLGNLRYRRV